MKAYCINCGSIQPSRFRPGQDAITNESYEDLCCDTCHFIVATIQDRESSQQPSQALELDLLERLSKTLTRLGYATPEGGMEHSNADLANQLYNLCRAVDSLFDREQPPAPSDTAITYMTGYSDGREWAQPSQAPQGCACRWDAEDNRIATRVRHQGWLDVVQEWADRAKGAEAKLEQPSQAGKLSYEEAVALLRFNETCEDGEGYDVPKPMMGRLAEIGVVNRKTFGIYQITEYGQRVIAAINAKGATNG